MVQVPGADMAWAV